MGNFYQCYLCQKDYFEKEASDEFIELGEGLSNAEAYGKYAMTETIRQRCHEETPTFF